MTRAEELHPSDETVPQDHGTMLSSDTVLLGRSVFHGSFPQSQVPFSWQASPPTTLPWEPGVSLIELKKMAQKMLDKDSVLRTLILEEPDQISSAAMRGKIEIFIRLLYKELAGEVR